MKKVILIINFIFSIVFISFGQIATENATPEAENLEDSVSTTDPVEIKKTRFKTTFYQNGDKVSASLLRDVVVKSPEAVLEMQLARKNYLPSVALNTVGGFLVGYSVGAALLGGNISWPLAGIGAGLLGIGIPLSRAYIRHAERAVSIHNKNLGHSQIRKTDLQFGMNIQGVGLKLTF